MRYGKNGKDKVNKYRYVRYRKLNHFLTTRNIHFYDENVNDESETVIEERFYDEYFRFIIDRW